MEQNLQQVTTNIIKITVAGPESTGKTTLCRQLAKHYNTVWVAEYAREYLQKKWDKSHKTCEPHDLVPIAKGQIMLENQAILTAKDLLFCDTNAVVTKVFSETYYGFCDLKIDQAAKEHCYDLFFLTDVDVPWQADDLRDKPNNRAASFEYFTKILSQLNKPFITLSGNENQRLSTAINIIDQLLVSKSLGFSSRDFIQIYQHQISIDDIANQLNFFKKGFQHTTLQKPATVSYGILNYSAPAFTEFENFFEKNKNLYSVQKFIPASGAASRMFKFLIEFLNDFNIEGETINAYINRKNAQDLAVFLVGLEKFPFYNLIKNKFKTLHNNNTTCTKDQHDHLFITLMLSQDFFDFANKPKGILPFYNFDNQIITATTQHLVETAQYCNVNKIAKVHFTISKEHQNDFEEIVSKNRPQIENNFDCKIEVSYSYQQKSTDTIAVDLQNNAIRNIDNSLIFRPAGHGALIKNLNSLDADIVFIKNIDNVSVNNINDIVFYKKALAGILITIQSKTFEYLQVLECKISTEKIDEIKHFLIKNCNQNLGDCYMQLNDREKVQFLITKLNRPIRICGMVKNEGEPGGGPFWIKNTIGDLSLQIVESSQVDLNNVQQNQILKSATHFNPVDLVCGLKNYKGTKFNLENFTDPNTGFIVQKNKNGQNLKGYELPGLWNGAMANWITVFVEVPLSTFNPVKTVNDLLKPAHQPI